MDIGDTVRGPAVFARPEGETLETVTGVVYKFTQSGLKVWVDTPDGDKRALFTVGAQVINQGSTTEKTVRAKVLDEAKRITATDRNSLYGEPENNFQRIADFWNVYLQDKLAINLTAGDTAALMIMVKLAREMNAPTEDNKVDMAGYAACWAEVDSKK